MKRSLALSAAATLMAGLLAGCSGSGDGGSEGSSASDGESAGDAGGGDTSSYCSDLEGARDDLGSLSGQAGASFEEAVATIRSLADRAPDEVAAEWQTLSGAVDDFEKALNGAGVELSDMDELSRGEIPEGVNPQKLQSLAGDLDELSSEETQKAADAVSTHAKEECDIDLQSDEPGTEGQ